MAKKHMADITNLLTPLRKQREEWLKVRVCPKCGKPSNRQIYANGDEKYSHFEGGVYIGSCQVCPTKYAPDRFQREPSSVIPLQASLFADDQPATMFQYPRMDRMYFGGR